nr:MAG TPA: hypothetical protein [Bacteriophage sp.]
MTKNALKFPFLIVHDSLVDFIRGQFVLSFQVVIIY